VSSAIVNTVYNAIVYYYFDSRGHNSHFYVKACLSYCLKETQSPTGINYSEMFRQSKTLRHRIKELALAQYGPSRYTAHLA
jgi:hypothetical protein